MLVLQATEFFQDWDMVKELCTLLGRRFFAVEQPSEKPHIAQACTPASLSQHLLAIATNLYVLGDPTGGFFTQQ